MFECSTLKFKPFIWEFEVFFFMHSLNFLDFFLKTLDFLINFVYRKLYIERAKFSCLNEILVWNDLLNVVFGLHFRLLTWTFKIDFIFSEKRMDYGSLLIFCKGPNVSQLIWWLKKSYQKSKGYQWQFRLVISNEDVPGLYQQVVAYFFRSPCCIK